MKMFVLSGLILFGLVLLGSCGHISKSLVPCVKEYGKFLCVCTQNGRYTDCSQLRLSYMPVIPMTTVRLNISRNAFQYLGLDMLRNISNKNLTQLDISYNNIYGIEQGFFAAFPYLERLHMGNNRLNSTTLISTFHDLSKTIRYLYMNSLPFPARIRDDFFQPLNGSNLTVIQCNFNHIKEFHSGNLFNYLPKLKRLDLSTNYLYTVVFNKSESLRHLLLSYNDLTKFPNFCINKTHSLFPSLRELFIDRNCLSTLEDRKLNCLEKMELLNISQTRLNTLHTSVFSQMRNLRTISLENIASFVAIQPYAFKSDTLKFISIAHNDLQFKSDGINVTTVFAGCPQLNGLDISGNFLGKLTETDWYVMLKPIPNLHFLNASFDGLRYLPAAWPTLLKNLTSLHVGYNGIPHIRDYYFTPFKHLTSLSMELNQFTWFKDFNLPQNLTHLNLIQNPYICGCAILWFKDFMARNKEIMEYYPEQYTCRKRGIPVADFEMNRKSCSVSYQARLIIITACLSLIILLFLFSVTYRFRWRLRYIFYLFNYHKRQITRNDGMEHDLFVSCAENDYGFVMDSIVQKLEADEEMRVFITKRDGLASHSKMKIALDHLDVSRFVMICLSNSYCQDQWCEFETNMALQKSIYDRTNNVIIVILEDISIENMTKLYASLFRSDNYILWDEDTDTSELFWRKLRSRLSV